MAVYFIMIFAFVGMGVVLADRKSGAKKNIFYLAAVFVCLTFLASFRYAIGFDYFSYRDIYMMTDEWTFCDIMQNYWYEPFFFLVCKILNLIGMPFQILILCVSIFVFYAGMRFIYDWSKIPWLSVYLYITLQFFAYAMNLMRQSIAVAFFLLSYRYLKNRKIMPFTVLILTGGLFHNSLWFMYPLYFLLPGRPTKIKTVCLIVIAAVLYIFFEPLFSILRPILPQKYAVYQMTYFWNSNSWEYVIFPAVYLILIYLFKNRIADSRLSAVYQNSALYYFLINLFITKHFILERFAVYPFAFSLTAIPDIVASHPYRAGDAVRKEQNDRCVLLLFLLFGGAYFLFAAAKGFHHVYPYSSLLDRSISVYYEKFICNTG